MFGLNFCVQVPISVFAIFPKEVIETLFSVHLVLPQTSFDLTVPKLETKVIIPSIFHFCNLYILPGPFLKLSRK